MQASRPSSRCWGARWCASRSGLRATARFTVRRRATRRPGGWRPPGEPCALRRVPYAGEHMFAANAHAANAEPANAEPANAEAANAEPANAEAANVAIAAAKAEWLDELNDAQRRAATAP